ncbi:MAG: ABC transporter permease [Sphingomonadaceae bacterium]|nr:ABC transporter permease [Sphingomonadaceae bacterium]
MWGNYLTVGLRTLARDRTYAFINIFGLAVGIAACMILLLYVRYETSYDAWLPGADRIFQVQSIPTSDSVGAHRPNQGAQGVLAEALPHYFPEIEAAARLDEDRLVFQVGGEAQFVTTMMTDPGLFRILKLHFLSGDPATALRGPDSLVLSRSQAVRLFGSADVLGRTITQIRAGQRRVQRVTGVFEDLPRNSSLDIQAATPLPDEDRQSCSWGCVNGYVYLKLRPGADAASINARLGDWERTIPPTEVGGQRVSEGDLYDWRLVNIRDVHLSGAEGSETRPGADARTIATFAIVALLILAMAAFNFVNLATARAGKRAREVALRKVLGARRKQLIAQFLGESLLISGIATLIALSFAELTLPYFSAYLDAELDLHYLGAGGLLGPVLGLWLAVGLVGGLYPAFYLSRYRPGEILKANQSAAEPRGTGRLRSLLVVGQFAVSIGLIACTIVVYHQTAFAQRSDLGFERDGLIQVDNVNRAAVVPQVETMLREIRRVPGVQLAAATTIAVATHTTLTANVQLPSRVRPETIGFYSVSPDFFRTMGVQLLAGRTLSRRHANDYAFVPYDSEAAAATASQAIAARGVNVLLNETAVRQLGFASPAAALGGQVRIRMFGDTVGLVPATIVGVVADSRFRSAREPIEPIIFYDGGIYRELVIRYSAANPEAVRQAVGGVWRRFAPDVPYEAAFGDDQLARAYASDAARGNAFAGFAILAVAIACLGLFGLAAFTAERRTREIGIRKVFGARTRDIVQLLAWQFARPVMIANLLAWPAAWWVMRDWLNGFDARIALTPAPFLVAGLLALAIATGTVAGHAFRVARTNPILALRYE